MGSSRLQWSTWSWKQSWAPGAWAAADTTRQKLCSQAPPEMVNPTTTFLSNVWSLLRVSGAFCLLCLWSVGLKIGSQSLIRASRLTPEKSAELKSTFHNEVTPWIQPCSNFLGYKWFFQFSYSRKIQQPMLLKPLSLQHAQVFAKSCEISTNIISPFTQLLEVEQVLITGRKKNNKYIQFLSTICWSTWSLLT